MLRKMSASHVRFQSPHASFSSLSDSGSEYGDYTSDSEGWSGLSSQESYSSSQSSNTSTMSADATGPGVEISLGSATPTQTQLGLPPLGPMAPPQPTQMPNPSQGILLNHPPIIRGRTLRKEDTLMSIDPTQAPSPAEAIAREVQALLDPRLQATFCNQYNRDRELLQMFAESIRYQMSEEYAEMRHEMAKLRQEVLDLRVQVERYRTGR
ncbi:hypothetical protein C8Q80DRAFT_1140044 [Daedaleopsis nitida]|nr:hypothetical protein C8Q80DRAFT_1140044 [Daedaleopsis nitida]